MWHRLQVYKSNTYHSLSAVRSTPPPLFPLSASTRTRQPLGDLQATRPDQTYAGVSRACRNSRRFRTYSGSLCLRGGLARELARAPCNFWCGARASERASTQQTERNAFSCTGVSLLRPPHTSSKALHNVFEARTCERVKETQTTKAPPHLATGLS